MKETAPQRGSLFKNIVENYDRPQEFNTFPFLSAKAIFPYVHARSREQNASSLFFIMRPGTAHPSEQCVQTLSQPAEMLSEIFIENDDQSGRNERQPHRDKSVGKFLFFNAEIIDNESEPPKVRGTPPAPFRSHPKGYRTSSNDTA